LARAERLHLGQPACKLGLYCPQPVAHRTTTHAAQGLGPAVHRRIQTKAGEP
jgi:hypothetical protein